MSDRSEESRPTSETGGWFVPKNAMNEQQIAASTPDAQEPAQAAPVANAAPTQEGAWHTPGGTAAAVSSSEPTTPPPVEPVLHAAQIAAVLPPGAGLSSEVDYNNYVPGKGFVTPGTASTADATDMASTPDATDAAPADNAMQPTDAQPAAEPEPVPDAADMPAAIAAAAAPAVPVAAAAPVVVQDTPVEPVRPVNPDLIKRYTDVERSVQVLRRRYSAGTLTRGQLQDELRKLMILDEDGYWWMIGLESDRWYKYNGTDWVQAPRPGKAADPQTAAPVVPAGPSMPPEGPQFGAPMTASPATLGTARGLAVEDTGPLPQRVPLNDLGATMVGSAAPRLDNTLKTPGGRQDVPRYLSRASQQGGASSFDGGVTMPSGSGDVTQAGAAVSGAGSVPSPYPRGGGPQDAAAGGAAKPDSIQPDYGEPPKGVLADRQRAVGCVVRLAVVSVFLAVFGAIIATGLLVLGYYSIISQYDKQIAGLTASVANASQSARILDKNGRVLYQINDPNLGSRIRVPLANISPDLIAATIATENRRFYEDPGFDVVSIVRAIISNLGDTSSGTGGASTITQQLTRALVLDPGAAQDRSVTRKITEIIVSSEIARRYTKSQIMEFYLNTVYYGNLAYGAEAASQTYFAKSAKDLNLAEAAFIAGLVQSPATYDPVQNREAALGRMDQVLTLVSKLGCIQMEHAPYDKAPFCIAQSDVNQAAVLVAKVKATVFHSPTNTAIYPHFVNYVQQQLETQFGKDALYSGGFTIYTTIDPAVQDIADKAVKDQIAALKGLNVTNGAVLAVRPADGAIVAMVGSADFNNNDIDGQFNVTLAPRQPGSSIKPFVYLASFERDANGNYWTPSTIMWDVPSCFGGSPSYCPNNYDNKFHGPQSVRNSIDNSFNIPAVKAIQYVGIDRFKAIAQRVGLAFPLTQPEQAGLTLALGGVEVPMINMVQGYSVLADGGNKVPFYSITKVTRKNGDVDEVVFEAKPQPAQQVVEPGLAYLMTNILSDNQARQFEFGNALALPDGRPAAVKTGTTNDSKDNWTIGYTPQLVVGVWVGNSNNSAMIGTSGVTGAAPIWKTVMTGALQGQPAMQFQPPSTDQQTTVCGDFGTLDFPDCVVASSRHTDVFFGPNPPPAPGTILKTVAVDSFSGLIANEACPDYVENRVFLSLSDDSAVAWLNNDPTGQQWAKDHKLTLPVVAPPTTACDPNTPRPVLKVANPQPNGSLQGLVQITGSVFVPAFNHYQIEVGTGLNASAFTVVDGPYTSQPNGDNQFLGRWDTTTKPNGAYTLRLFAADNAGHHAQIVVPVIVNNLGPTPTQPPIVAATATPAPAGGQQNGTLAPIVILPNPTDVPQNPGGATATSTLKPIFPPTDTPHP